MRMQRWVRVAGLAGAALVAATATASATTEPPGVALAADGSAGVVATMAVVALAAVGMVMFGRERAPARVPARRRR